MPPLFIEVFDSMYWGFCCITRKLLAKSIWVLTYFKKTLRSKINFKHDHWKIFIWLKNNRNIIDILIEDLHFLCVVFVKINKRHSKSTHLKIRWLTNGLSQRLITCLSQLLQPNGNCLRLIMLYYFIGDNWTLQ